MENVKKYLKELENNLTGREILGLVIALETETVFDDEQLDELWAKYMNNDNITGLIGDEIKTIYNEVIEGKN